MFRNYEKLWRDRERESSKEIRPSKELEKE